MTVVRRNAKNVSPIAQDKLRADPLTMRADSALDPIELAHAWALLEPPKRRERVWPVLGAAALLAIAALSFATAMIMAPPVISEHVAPQHAAQ